MVLLAASPIRITIMWAWMLSPPPLVLLALRDLISFRKQATLRWNAILAVLTGIAVLGDWIVFVVLIFSGQIGGFGTHYLTNRRVWIFPWLSLLLLGGVVAAPAGKGKLAAAIALVFGLWAGSLIVA